MDKDRLHAELKKLSEGIKRKADKCKNNEAQTKTALIEPFIKILGYKVSDPDQVSVEHDIEGNKCDYALIKNDQPVILIEAKSVDNQLSNKTEMKQLNRYFSRVNASLAVLTNGKVWKWYTAKPDQKIQEIDNSPAVEFNCEDLSTIPLDFLDALCRENLSPQNIEEMAYKELLKARLSLWTEELFINPPERVCKIALEENNITDSQAIKHVKSVILSLLTNKIKDHKVVGDDVPLDTESDYIMDPDKVTRHRAPCKLWLSQSITKEKSQKTAYFRAVLWLLKMHKNGYIDWLKKASTELPAQINTNPGNPTSNWLEFCKIGNQTYYIHHHFSFEALKSNLKRLSNITILENGKPVQFEKDIKIEKI